MKRGLKVQLLPKVKASYPQHIQGYFVYGWSRIVPKLCLF